MKNFALAIPTYKRYKELKELMATIPSSVPVYISDNGGTLPDSFCETHPNAIVTKVTPAVAMFPNWNLAAKFVKSDWLAVPSDDDLYYPGSFDLIEKYLNQYSDSDMIVFGHNTIDSNGNTLTKWIPRLENFVAPHGFNSFQYGVEARMPSIFIKTDLFKNLGGFDEGFDITAADSDLIQRVALVGKVQFVPDVVSGYRVWDGGLTHKKIASDEWMMEIERWCHRIMIFCQERGISLYTRKVQDEIYARNLLSGIIVAKRSDGYITAWKHALRCRYPSRALMSTQLRIFYRLVKP